ncbi:MAG TPA: hypothetical protein VFQ45_14575 [Longimicrobium sp.]|nr:hypothetical protein [Longimicrobium sp.]
MLPVNLGAALVQADPTAILGSGVLLAVAAFFGLVFFAASRYRRCPANKVLVVSGRVGGGNAAKCISGGGALVWPIIQEFDYLSLEPIQIDIPLKDALSFENIRVNVPSVFTVASARSRRCSRTRPSACSSCRRSRSSGRRRTSSSASCAR